MPKTRLLAAGVLLAVFVMVGCSPTETPAPTPTPLFATEEEAYAAAEEVYRAYNDAMLALLSGDDTADPFKYTVGTQYDADLRIRDQMRSNGTTLQGEHVILSFTGISATLDEASPRINVETCIDSSGTRVFDAEGVDITPAERLDRAGFKVTFVAIDKVLVISSSELLAGSKC